MEQGPQMIRYLYADQLNAYPRLTETMFRDRAEQFSARLGWDVTVDQHGYERDQYDSLNPLYVVWQRGDGRHGGSMRFLPTIGRTMVNEHFLGLTEGVRIESPLIWECTRFCLSANAAPQVSAALMAAGGEILQRFGLTHFVGVFDARMIRIYRVIGASPDILGMDGHGRDAIGVGLWSFNEEARLRVLHRAGLSGEISSHWFDRAFGRVQRHMPLALSA
jgi:acyl homoserine lactone synthase